MSLDGERAERETAESESVYQLADEELEHLQLVEISERKERRRRS